MKPLLALAVLLGQAAVSPVFEVASIKEAQPLSLEHIQAGSFHVGLSIDGSRADYGFMSLADLIPYAYRVKRFQVSGPGWTNDTRWDIQAKFPAGQSPDRAPEMMQNLLAERFKLAMHRETRELPVYELVVGTGSLKIQEAAAEEANSADASVNNVRMNIDGNHMTLSGGAAGTVRVGPGPTGMQWQMPKITMAALANILMQFSDRPVIDATQLKRNYQVTLDLGSDFMTGMPGAQKLTAMLGLGSFGTALDQSHAAIFQAVKELGLDLKSARAPTEMIVVDHLEKNPTAN